MHEDPRENFVLIVDDNQAHIDTLQNYLVETECTVIPTNRGQETMELIQRYQPQIIFLDNKLPDIDVFALCADIKSDPISSDIPILFSGVNVDPRHQEKYFLAGGADYFIKPFLKGIVVPRFKIHLELKQTRERLEAANRKLANLAKTDGLTGISNRREFDDFLEEKWPDFTGMKKAVSLILCDVDYFKKYNDTYGHQAGDECLKKIASAINGITSHEHLAARYGGEELAVVMPGVEIDEAQSFADLIMKQIHKLELAHEKSDVSEYVTLSIGVFCVIPSQSNTIKILVSGADEALYEAKNAGRDRIIAKDENANKAP